MLDKTDDISAVAANWLAEFESAIAKPEAGALDALFHPDSFLARRAGAELEPANHQWRASDPE